MIQQLFNIAKSLVLGLLFFFAARFTFALVNVDDLCFSSFASSAYHGLLQDLSVLSYWLLLAMILNILSHYAKYNLTRVVQHIMYASLAIFLAINIQLYGYWNYHLDSSVLGYLVSPKEALASVVLTDVLSVTGYVLILLAVYVLTVRALKLKWSSLRLNLAGLKFLIPAVIVLALLARGGWSNNPMTVSRVFHSTDYTYNQIAVNPVWNAGFSLTKEQYDYWLLDDDEAVKYYKRCVSRNDSLNQNFYHSRPKVILVIVESLSSNFIESFGGISGVSPNVDAIARDAICFDRYYASGDRSDRGLTTMITGMPAVPGARLLQSIGKLNGSPNINKSVSQQGGRSSFYYGGDASFANIRTLFDVASNTEVIDVHGIESSGTKGKWGYHDEVVYGQVLNDINQKGLADFTVIFTLSSHEPFDHPPVSYSSQKYTKPMYGGIYYADSCLGDFVDRLRQLPEWENTMVVITADHGSVKPNGYQIFESEKYRIPLIFSGGVVKNSRRYHHVVGQADLAYTLSEFFGETNNPFIYGKSLFDTSQSFASYYYQVGAGIVRDSSELVFDYKLNQVLHTTSENDSVAREMKLDILGYSQHAVRTFEGY